MQSFNVVIIGAGPAGVTAAHELARHGGRGVLLVEASQAIGGLSQTVNYKGNRIDIGGHRFFSKSDWVMDWWKNMMPVAASGEGEIHYQGKNRRVQFDSASVDSDRIMLVRQRLSRIYFDKKFFDYPLKTDLQTALKLGPVRCANFLGSYLRAHTFPIKPEQSLQDFFINRFGRSLYETFFRDYTEKVWGVPCSEISAEWGAQRVKSLSIGKAIGHALMKPFRKADSATATSLIEKFLYPKFGPGQMWETASQEAAKKGVELWSGWKAESFGMADGRIRSVVLRNAESGETRSVEARHVISTMPVRELARGLGNALPAGLREVAEGLQYRDFITVGLLYRKLLRNEGARPDGGQCTVPDNWIYIQEPGVKVGRLQFFNNWSPWMVSDTSRVWLGMEFFCQEGDGLWNMSDEALKRLGAEEMEKLGLARQDDCEDGVVVRAAKAYPGYYGTYPRFGELRAFLDAIPNLYLVGRNGMHRYNNQDHSMLSSRLAVESIIAGAGDKAAIWNVNIDDEYHEEKETSR
jgi:protoporphyrinogen oxidase